MERDDGEVKQRQHLYHHGDTTCHPKSVTKRHGTSTYRCNNNTIFSDRYFPVSCRLRMPATLIWPRRSIGSSCQTGKMAALLNSLFFMFKILFLPKYRVIYYRGRNKPKLPLVRRISDMLQTTCPPVHLSRYLSILSDPNWTLSTVK